MKLHILPHEIVLSQVSLSNIYHVKICFIVRAMAPIKPLWSPYQQQEFKHNLINICQILRFKRTVGVAQIVQKGAFLPAHKLNTPLALNQGKQSKVKYAIFSD